MTTVTAMHALFFLVACILGIALPHQAYAKTNLLVTGSSTVAPLMQEVAQAFEKKTPDTRIEVQTGGSTRGLIDVQQGLSDIGMLSRDLTASEVGVQKYELAMDGLAFVVHAKNPLTNLSKSDLQKIYRGEIRNWKQLGGADQAITVISKVEGRAALDLFMQYFEIKASQIKAQSLIGDNEQGLKIVAGNPWAIAYLSVSTANVAVQNKVPVKILSLDKIAASVENVKNGSYPFARKIILITKMAPSAESKKLIDFALSKEMVSAIEKMGFVPTH